MVPETLGRRHRQTRRDLWSIKIALVAEVADSRLAQARKLAARVYGPAGLPACWIINLIRRQVEVYTNPGPKGYASRAVFREGQSISLEIDGQALGQIAVDDVLPARPSHEPKARAGSS